jgi:asparaginyl-tRNA synthetase
MLKEAIFIKLCPSVCILQELKRTHSTRDVLRSPEGTEVKLLGWVAVKNQVGGVVFIRLRDGTGYVQLSGRKGKIPNESWEEATRATTESAVYAEGVVKDDPRAPFGKEVTINKFKVIAPAEPWPLRKSLLKSRSALYDLRHLAIRGRRSSAVLKVRSELIRAVFEYFYGHGYVYIQTPILVGSAVEGGATLFSLKYFDEVAYLSQSAQLYEEAAICSLDRVFIFQPAFRAEKSKTTRHLTEFWMIESELAFTELDELLTVEEELVHHMAKHVSERCTGELEVLGKKLMVPEPPFPRIDYTEALQIAERKGIKIEWGEDLGTEAERVVSQSFEKPVFVKGYPLSARSFYHMEDPHRKGVSMSADLLAGGIEIATGGQRIHEYDVLLQRVVEHGLDPERMKWYLELRKYGMPPHSGFGLGVERALKWMLDLKHIRAASIFPRTPNRLYP